MSGSKGGGGGGSTISRILNPISMVSPNVASVINPVMSYLTTPKKEWKSTTMGRWFQSPSTKMPESKGSGSAQAVADAASEKSMMAAKEAEKKRLRAAAGRSSLIKTSGRGVLEPATTKKKKLLGE